MIYPRLPHALFGLDPLPQGFARDAAMPDIDPEPIRQAVADVLAALPQR